MLKRSLAIPAAAGLILLAAPAAGAAVLRSGADVWIPPGETIRDDLYLAGGRVRLEGRVEGDVYVAGGQVTITGPIGGRLTAAGGSVRLAGPVGASARVAASDARLEGTIGQDALVGAGRLVLAPGASVGRTLFAGAGEAELAGRAGALRARANRLALSGEVQGPAEIEALNLAIGATAHVAGPLRYDTASLSPVAEGARLDGPRRGSRYELKTWPRRLAGALAAFLMAFVFGALALWLAPGACERVAESAFRRPWRRALVGLGVLLGMPVAAILLMLTVVGLPVGLTALLAYGVAVGTAPLAAAWAIARRFRPRGRLRYAAYAGALALTLLARALPAVGPYVAFGLTLWGLGALAAALVAAWPKAAAAPPEPEAGAAV